MIKTQGNMYFEMTKGYIEEALESANRLNKSEENIDSLKSQHHSLNNSMNKHIEIISM